MVSKALESYDVRYNNDHITSILPCADTSIFKSTNVG